MTESVWSTPILFAENVEACAKGSTVIHKRKNQTCPLSSKPHECTMETIVYASQAYLSHLQREIIVIHKFCLPATLEEHQII